MGNMYSTCQATCTVPRLMYDICICDWHRCLLHGQQVMPWHPWAGASWPVRQMPLQQESVQTAAVHAADTSGQVQEYLLTNHQTGGRQWLLQRDNISIKDKAVFAPANLRATAENEEYQQLVQYWMSNKYTLRYSGGMVPDIHHILTKVGQHPSACTSFQALHSSRRFISSALHVCLVVMLSNSLAFEHQSDYARDVRCLTSCTCMFYCGSCRTPAADIMNTLLAFACSSTSGQVSS